MPFFDILHNSLWGLGLSDSHINEKFSLCQSFFEKNFPKFVEIKKFFYFVQRNVSSFLQSDENIFRT